MILSYGHEPRLRLGFGPSSLSRLVHASHVVKCIGTPLFMVGGWSLSAPPERWFVETSRDECAIYVVQIRLLGVSRVNGRGAGTELGPRDRDLGLPVRELVRTRKAGRRRVLRHDRAPPLDHPAPSSQTHLNGHTHCCPAPWLHSALLVYPSCTDLQHVPAAYNSRRESRNRPAQTGPIQFKSP